MTFKTWLLYRTCYGDSSPPELVLGVIWLRFLFYTLGLAASTAHIIICVAFNAIRVSDVPRNQLQSSAKVLGLKHMTKKDKSYLLKVVAQGLLDQGFIKIKRNLTNPTRDDIVKLKAF